MPEPAITGTMQAAILMMAVGEEAASEVMKFMSPKEVQRLGGAMGSLSNVSQAQVDRVLEDLHKQLGETTSLGVSTPEYVKKVLQQALGEDRGNSMIARIFQQGETTGLDMLRWMDPRTIADAIRLEHPQIIAIILSYLDKDLASQIGELLPRNIMADVLMRIATLESVPSLALQELSDVLEKTFDGRTGSESSKTGGVRSAADIVNALDGAISAELLDQIRENDATLAENIEELLFVFEDIGAIADKGIQTILREIQSDTLLIALKGTSPQLKEKFFSNMSKRAGDLLREDLEAKGPVRLSDVEQAQKEILVVVRGLIDSGDIAGGSGDEFV